MMIKTKFHIDLWNVNGEVLNIKIVLISVTIKQPQLC